MPYSQKDYEEAKAALASGDIPKEHTATVQARVAQYEDDRARGQNPAPADEGRVPSPAIEAPKPGATGFWKPQRPLGAADYIPQDTGGNLAVWRDMPVEVYRRKVLEPQRSATIAAGEKAMMDFQRFGANAFSPQDQMARTLAIAQGQAAAAQDPRLVDEKDPGYKQFNDQQWQQAVQQRQQDPNAGPIQRLEMMLPRTGPDGAPVAGTSGLFYTAEKGKDLLLSGARGALDMATLGLGTGALDAATEAMSGRETVDVGRGLEEAHPFASGLGGAAMAVLRPTLGSAGIATKVFGKAAPALGRYGAAALSGAASGAAEGLGHDLGAEGADQLSDSPSAVMERGRLDPERLAINTALRGGGGAIAGAGGQLIADAGRGLANRISESAIKGTQGRSPYEAAEAAGYQFDPVLGIRAPSAVKAQQALTRETKTSWAERYADKAGPQLAENLDRFAVGEKAAMGKENLSYFNSIRNGNDLASGMTPITNTNKAAIEISNELRGVDPKLAVQVRQLVQQFDPVMLPKQMGAAVEKLSGMAQAAESGSDTLRAKAMKQLQAAMMEDIKALPHGNLEGTLAEGPDGETLEGWPALRSEHASRTGAIDEARQLTGVRNPGRTLPDDVAELNRNLMNQGKKGVSVKQEAALDRFMPPDLKRETLMLRAANMVDDISSGNTMPYPSQAGLIKRAAGMALPRLYGLGRAVSRPPDNFPISDKMFAFMNSRIPRATMFVPGMDLSKMVQERLAMDGRPKTFKDLSPEQQSLLLEMVSPEQKELLQENPR